MRTTFAIEVINPKDTELNLFGTGPQACIADMGFMYRCCWITSFTNWLSWCLAGTLDLANEYMCNLCEHGLVKHQTSIKTLQQMPCKIISFIKSIPTIHNNIFRLPTATHTRRRRCGAKHKFVRYNSLTRSSQSLSLACVGSFCIWRPSSIPLPYVQIRLSVDEL